MQNRNQTRANNYSLRDIRQIRAAACRQTGLFFGAVETPERDAEERKMVGGRSVPVVYAITTNREALVTLRC